MAAVTIGNQENKVCHCLLCFPTYLLWIDGIKFHDLSFLRVLSQLFHSPLSPSSRDSNCFLLSAIRVVSSAYLRLLIFLPAILIPACASSRLAFRMMYSACKLNKQSDNVQPWRTTPLLIWNQSIVPCPVLTVAPWPAYTFLRMYIIMYKILVKIWMVKGYCDVVSDANEEHAVGQQRTVCPCNLVKHLAKLCSFSSVWWREDFKWWNWMFSWGDF